MTCVCFFFFLICFQELTGVGGAAGWAPHPGQQPHPPAAPGLGLEVTGSRHWANPSLLPPDRLPGFLMLPLSNSQNASPEAVKYLKLVH